MKKALVIAIAALLVFSVAAFAIGETKTAEGVVKKVDATAKSLVITAAGKDMTFILLPTVNAAELKVGDKVKVEYTELLGKMTATKVTVVK